MLSDIGKLSKQKKSAMLARVMGWELQLATIGEPRYAVVDENGKRLAGSLYFSVVDGMGPVEAYENLCPKLYSEPNMALAKKVIEWGYGNIEAFQVWLHKPGSAIAVLVGAGGFPYALDKILLLAIEAGIIEEGK